MTKNTRLRMIAILLVAAFIATFAIPSHVEAKAVTGITLRYNEGTQTLFVNVTHQVTVLGGPDFVELIEIFKNGVFQLNRTYTEQVFKFGRNDTFAISAVGGDNLTVTATCSKGYSLLEWIIVGASTTTTGSTTSTPTQTETETTTPPPQPADPLDPAIAIGVGSAGIVVFMIVFVMYKEGYIAQFAQRVRR
jgi:hypothetical protein